MIVSYILHSLDNAIAQSVIFFTTAREIWKDSEEHYDQSSGPHLYTLQQSLCDLSQGFDASIAEYFTQIKASWDQINGVNTVPVCTCDGCTCNLTKQFLMSQQDERLVQLLMKSDNKYASVRTNNIDC